MKQWVAYGESKIIQPNDLHSPLQEGKGAAKRPVEVTREQVDGRRLVEYHPKPARYFPEGPNTFWVGLFVDG
jgi:hypothetical protein